MKSALWAVLGFVALFWSLLAWAFHSLAASGGAAVVTVTRWLDIEPSTTQWIADGLALAGGVAQWLVVLVWLVGIGVLALLGWLVSQTAVPMATFPGGNASEHSSLGPVIEGQVRDRTLS